MNASRSWAGLVKAIVLRTLCICAVGIGGQLALPQQAQAQSAAFQVQQFRPWMDPDGMFQTQSGRTMKQWNYLVGLYFNYSRDAFVLRDKQGNKVSSNSPIQNQFALDFVGGIAFFDFLELDVAIPMTLYQTGSLPNDPQQFGALAGRSTEGFAFSDIKVQVKAQALRQEKHFVNLGFRVFLGIPTGDKERFNGEDGVSFGLAAMVDRTFAERVTVALNFGYRYLPPSTFLDLVIQNELTYSLGVGVKVVKNYFDLIADFAGAVALSDKTSLQSAPLDMYLGARFYPLGRPDLAINVGGGAGIFYPGYGSPQFRVFAGLTWSPRVIDTDKDGLLDNVDKCPKVPGPRENKGCPWGDKDNDGLKDNVDKCPSTPGPKENNGCPWGDKDGDGLKDNVDKCPATPGPKENKGCPWGDKDGDGIKDNVDKCPTVKGPKENKGCPWGDKDKDGIKDNVDRCPTEPGPAKFKGCPDSDKDGIANIDDKCPFVAGVPERKGCPKVVLVQVTKKEIKILQKIYFAFGSARIRLRSYKVLNQVVEVLKSRPKIKIRIEGHTDSIGSASSNLRLSKRRAASVRRYLSKKGIVANRLTSEGYGESKPLVKNNTKSNRAKNRRVQFKIVTE